MRLAAQVTDETTFLGANALRRADVGRVPLTHGWRSDDQSAQPNR